MNKLGMNLFAWTVTMDEELADTYVYLQKAGFDFLEVPINISLSTPVDLSKWQRIGQQISSAGLGIQACTICGPEYNLISSDAAIRRAGIDYLKRVIDCASALGATILMGPIYAGFKTFTGKPATTDEWNWSVAGMREVAQYAQQKDVMLAVEYLNRFETYLLTCADELVRYIEAIDHPNCRAAFDTFHANLEEKNIAQAIQTCAPYLIHVQISENDRSTPGQGHVDFEEVFGTLQDIGYDGPIAIEAFGLNPPEMAAAAHIFRPMFESPEQLATDGLAFIRSRMEKRERSAIADGEKGRNSMPRSLFSIRNGGPLPLLLLSLLV